MVKKRNLNKKMKKYFIILLVLIPGWMFFMNSALRAEEMSLAKADIGQTNKTAISKSGAEDGSQSLDMSQLMELMKFDGMDVTEALKYLSIRSGMNIVTSKTVTRSEEHTSELQSHSFISYAVFCLKKKKTIKQPVHLHTTVQ